MPQESPQMKSESIPSLKSAIFSFEKTSDQLDRIAHDEIKEEAFKARQEKKFLCDLSQVAHLLSLLPSQSLIVGQQKAIGQAYRSLYFDTPDFHHYMQHHRGALPRSKFRLRTYDEQAFFAEIKRKTNTGMGEKERIALNSFHANNIPKGFWPEGLEAKLETTYYRMAFYEPVHQSRLTIDLNFSIATQEKKSNYPQVAIIECKSGLRGKSLFHNMLQQSRLVAQDFSKYCFGVNQCYPEIKNNRFLRRNQRFLSLAKTKND